MKEQFIEKRFGAESLRLIQLCAEVIETYQEAGYSLTLRQLYYQLVARAYIENTERSYKRTGSILNDARLAGLIDWDAIEDRTRNVRKLQTWDNPKQIVDAAVNSYIEDLWDSQPCHVEVWVEKEALADIVGQAANKYRVPYLACRGYMSQSEQYAAAKRFERAESFGQHCVLIHLGDHDPSGIDMTRDNEDRLVQLSGGANIEVVRIALNMEQVEELKPPPNPAKETDSRHKDYQARFGDSSWELDALEPAYLADLIKAEIDSFIDQERWDEAMAIESENRDRLEKAAKKLAS